MTSIDNIFCYINISVCPCSSVNCTSQVLLPEKALSLHTASSRPSTAFSGDAPLPTGERSGAFTHQKSALCIFGSLLNNYQLGKNIFQF